MSLRTYFKQTSPKSVSTPTSPPSTPKPFCVFVFSGGGLNGAAQAGMVKELLSAGVVPDAIVGVSAGALNAVHLASTPLPYAGIGLIKIWQKISVVGIYNAGSSKRLWNIVRQHDSIDPGIKLASIITQNCTVRDLSECNIPVRIGALNLETGKNDWWGSGESFSRLFASAAIPGIFPPIEIDGTRYADGASVSPIPVSAALEFSPTRIIILDVSLMDTDFYQSGAQQVGPSPSSALGVLLSSFEAARRQVAKAELNSISSNVDIVMIKAGLRGVMATDGAAHIPEVIELGAAAARRAIAEHPSMKNHAKIAQIEPVITNAPVMVPSSISRPLRELSAISAYRRLTTPSKVRSS